MRAGGRVSFYRHRRSDGATLKVEIEEEKEGEHVDTTDFFFEKIGEPVPIKSQEDSLFDLRSPPPQALALSQRFQLLFLAHSSGFLVARTKDVINLAKDIKETGSPSSIEDLSLVDVPIGKLRILALSPTDDSTLAVSVAADIHFFNVNTLLNKEIKPCFSISLPQSSFVKDFRWRKKKDNSFLVLSDDSKLYHGTLTHPLKHVMDNVDAVEWSVKGAFVAVAKDDSLSILSAKFNEKLCMVLPFKSWIGDCNGDCTVKVDTIRWARPDCIVLGCFQFTADGEEENYLVQVVKSKTGKITDATSDLVVLSFSDLFAGLIDDIVPFRTGPYLFLSYLEQCELAIAANIKNTDQHIVLLSWSLGETGEASVIDIERDNWLPRIELQENGDDNLIMGLCIDKVSLFGNVKVQLGVEEVKELSPYCVLICLTLEGKLIMFHIASVTKNAVPFDVAAHSDKEEDTPAVVPEEFNLPKLTYGQGEQKSEQVASVLPLLDQSKKELLTNGSEIPIKSDVNLSERNVNSVMHATNEAFDKDNIQRSVSLQISQSFEAVGQQKPPTTKPLQEAGSQRKLLSGQQGTNSGQSFLKTSQLEGPGNKLRDGSQTETQKIAGVGSIASFGGKFSNDTLTQPNHENVPKNFELVKESVGKTGSIGSQSASFQPWPIPSSQSLMSGKHMLSEESDARSSFSPSSHIQCSRSLGSGVTMDTTCISISNVGKPSHLKDTAGTSISVDKFSGRPVDTQKYSMGAGNIESVPLICGSQLSSQLNFALEKSPNQKLYHPKDDYKSSTQSGMRTSEPHLSKQFSNIREMAEELDTLLESIEETGGFRDACTVYQKSSVEALERGIAFLSDKCRRWENMMDEHLGKIQHLLDKTVQVLARKIYMEGIVKQASDSQYWDLWNRQKLSSELELKRRHILKLNRDLTNELIELERHFNTFELHKFGDNNGVDAGWRALQSRFGSSRHIQSLHTLHNTMNSQLAAAEQLSECLSQQMAMLSVESPVKQQNVKKELFQTIGLAYDASFTSPGVTKPSNTSSVKKLVLSSGSTASRIQSRRNPSSALKSFDPEIARRRRDSLDQSWASFEPSKTTVKRMLLQESASVKRTSFTDKQNFSPYAPEESTSSLSKEHPATSAMFYQSGKEGTQDAFPKQESESTLFRWANNSLVAPQSTGWNSSTVQTSNFSALSSTSGSQPMVVQNRLGETCSIPVAKSNTGASHLERFNSSSFYENEIQFTQQFRPDLCQELSISQVASLPKKSTDIPNSDGKGTVLANSALGYVKQVPSTTKSTLFGSSNNYDPQFMPPAAVSASPTLSAKVSQVNFIKSKSQPSEKVSESSAFSKPVSDSSSTLSLSSSFSTVPTSSVTSIPTSVSMSSSATMGSSSAPNFSFSTSFSIVSTSSSGTQFSDSMTSSIVSAHANRKASSSSSSPSIFPSAGVSSSNSLSIHPHQIPVPFPSDSPPVSSPSEILKTEAQPRMETLGLKKNVDSMTQALPLQHELPAAGLSLKPEAAVSSSPICETPTRISSGSQSSIINVASPASNLASNAHPVQPATGDILFTAPLSTSISTTDGKSGSLDVTVTQEDEMEEEAPETNQRTELSLGSLSSFGNGSTPNPTAPKPNPFGAPFGIVAPRMASSSFTTALPSGELFRPASFSFQSPQPSQLAHPANFGAFSGGFASSTSGQAPAQRAFGQPAQLGVGQQALGSVLGSFGQSRQIGTGLPGSGFASVSGFGGGFAGSQSAGGFSNAATGGGFAGIASSSGGFAALASGGGGFGGLASGGVGFGGLASGGGGFGLGSAGGFTAAASGGGGGGGFAAAAAAASGGGGFAGAASGGGFGAFSSQQGNGGFSAFGGGAGQTGKPPELFTQMRR
ncbi:Nuclear pore complex protein, putative [Theobroma cacao]|uniref:Nuclear pore complex protein, putative n=1 Tax=Theobroma cacao TaxID=3641 RepID=A0A061GS92_THECC|nr:Nuclear pore complex protein, putative [Theobroma cacao]